MGRETKKRYFFDDFVLDVAEYRLSREGKEISLRPKTFDTLVYLVERHGHLVTKDELMGSVWAESNVSEGVLTQSIFEIREALRSNSGSANYVATVPKLGYKFVAAVREEPPASDTQRVGKGRLKNWIGLLAGAAVIILVVAWRLDLFEPTRPSVEPHRRSIAVMPFKNYSDPPAIPYLGDVITEQITAQLVKLHDFKIISARSAMQYRDSQKSSGEIASELGVSYLLEGDVRRGNGNSVLNVRLTDTLSDEQIWAESYSDGDGDLFEIEVAVARDVASFLRAGLAPELGRKTSMSAEVYRDYYLPGRHFMGRYWAHEDPELLKSAISSFEKATEKSPGSAEAWASLGGGLWALSFWHLSTLEGEELVWRSRDALRRAIEIDESLAGAHVSLANLLYVCDLDWASAEAEFQRALDLSPGSRYVRHDYALFLERMGRWEEALEQIKQAYELSPVELGTNANLGLIYMDVGDGQSAVEVCSRALAFYPEVVGVHYYKALAHVVAGDYRVAVQVLENAVEHFGSDEAFLPYVGYVHALAGEEKKATDILEELIRRVEAGEANMFASRPVRGIVGILVALGRKDEAFEWLNKLTNPELVFDMYRGPWFKPLHGDPRWTELRRRVGLEQ